MRNIKKHKQKKKMPVGMILLIIFLIWNVLKQAGTALSGHVSVDAGLLNYYNLSLLGNIFFFIIITLNILSIYAIFTKKKWGYKILISFFILNIVLIIFTYFLSISNTDLLKELAFKSRTERGLHTNAIEYLNPAVLGIISLLFSIFYLLLIYYVYKKKNYFLNHNANTNNPKRK
ncbi:MAG: hypothetical protein AABX83_01375 [Nanoarchaeota archaeon]